MQHGDISCLEHCLYVSYTSYVLCEKLGLDKKSAARAALLHDFFLYDWHKKDGRRGWHGFTHPRKALENAAQHFSLSPMEQNIILRHMWPLTPLPPRYKESFIVTMADKYCALSEVSHLYHKKRQRRLQMLYTALFLGFS